jgi:16S rRNA (guanine(966)-N(2))-methyltransferase RsmD
MPKSASSKQQKPARATKAPHQVRIIGGQWKRTPLTVLDAAGLRPTPDRVRETVFNWLQHLRGNDWSALRCLDLFAGSGALGFEAASRGAAEVVLVEQNAACAQQLLLAAQKLNAIQVAVVRADGLRFAQQGAPSPRATAASTTAAARYDLIFLDPPFQHDWLAQVLPLCAPLLTPDGLVYVEAEYALGKVGDVADAANSTAGWEIIRAQCAGMVFFHLLQRKNAAPDQA